jgi:hypothetical protein
MYGNVSFDGQSADAGVSLTPEERKRLRRDLTHVAARTRELLPGDFVVGSELTSSAEGPRATIAVRPPIGSVVSAGYTPERGEDVHIDEDERNDLALGLAASAALQVKQSMPDNEMPAAQ